MKYEGPRRELMPEPGDSVTLVVQFNGGTIEIDVPPDELRREPEHGLEDLAWDMARDLITHASLRIKGSGKPTGLP